ncbi:thioredoxin-like protein, partial [Thamnocephalis sphaerospora]
YILADDQSFEGVVERVQGTVIVDFFANWCGPCRTLGPVLTNVAKDADIPLVKLDVDVAQEVASKYGIASLPTVIVFHNGKPVNHFIGALNENGVRQFVE